MNYLRQILRRQKGRKSLVIINILGLSICVAAALLLFLYVRFVLSYDSFHDGEKVYRVESRLYDGEVLTDNWATTTYGHAPVMLQEIPGIETIVRLTAQDREQVVTYQDKQFVETKYCTTEPSFFEIFNFPIIQGDKKGQLTRPNTLVLSRTTAERYFGKGEPIGKTLTFRTATAIQHYEVTGVIDDMPANSHLHFDFLLSYATIPPQFQDIWYVHGVYTYVRLESGKKPEEIEKVFTSISDKYKTEALKHKTWQVELIPLSDIHLTPQKGYEKESKGNKTAIYILSIMAIALLLIGWANALNLMVARSLERGKEFGVRKAFGTSHLQILLQGVLEAGLINLIATLLALGWLEVLLPPVYSLAGIPFGVHIWTQIDFWVVVSIIVVSGTIVIGLYPSILMTRIRPTDIMRGRLLHGKKGNVTRKALIVVQFLASFILVSSTFVVICQVRFMQQETKSDKMEKILVVKYPSFTEDLRAKVISFKQVLKQKPAIAQVSISGAIPGVEVANYFTNRMLESDPSDTRLMQMFSVDTDYLDTYQQELVSGRGFGETYGDETNHVVLNEEAIKALGYPSNEEAVGRKLVMEILEEPLTIIGVVKNYHQESLAVPYKPILFFITERVPFIATPYISIRLNSTRNKELLAEIKQEYKEFFPTSLFSYFYLDHFQAVKYKEDRNFRWIFASAALLAIFIACMGLWVITFFSSLARKKEVSIRKVLGAANNNLFVELTRELISLTVIASLIGIPISIILMNRWLTTYAFHISLPWWIFPLTFICLVCIALISICRQIWKVIRTEPIETLKNV